MAHASPAHDDVSLPLLRALRATVPDGDRSRLTATERCVLNADDEGYGGELAEQALAELKRPQAFFAQLAAEARKPSFGEMAAGWTRALLIRAQEAGLYDPQENA